MMRLLIVVENEVEEVRDFATKAEASAFEDGFGMAAGLLGSPSWSICTKVDDGPWTIEDQAEPSQQKLLADALAEAKRRRYEV
jgi:hypothetical protein